MSHVPCPCIQAERAEAKAGMWRGASPASEADRVQATQRAWQCTYSVHMHIQCAHARRAAMQRARRS
jgi:hypothetical protein